MQVFKFFVLFLVSLSICTVLGWAVGTLVNYLFRTPKFISENEKEFNDTLSEIQFDCESIERTKKIHQAGDYILNVFKNKEGRKKTPASGKGNGRGSVDQ